MSRSVEATPPADPQPFPGQLEEEKERQQAAPTEPESLEDVVDAPSAQPTGGAGRGALELGKSRDDASSARKRKSKGASSKAPPKASSGSSAMPKQEPKPARPRDEGERSIGDPERLLANLTSLEGQLRSAGIRLPQDAGSDKDDAAQDYDCEKVCELQGAICGLEERICDLAAAHPEDDRYARACQRASGDCRVAKQACSACD